MPQDRDRKPDAGGAGSAGPTDSNHWQHRASEVVDAGAYSAWCADRVTQLMAAPLQRSASAEVVHGAAAHGLSGSAQALPHLDTIQTSFGAHDVSGVQAHVGGPATAATAAMGATAYATGNSVAFAGAPDLHTAAHEAAHVVQQRAGVHLKNAVGEVGDVHERHADAVADAVVGGRSAAPLLDSYRDGGVTSTAVQRSTPPGEQPAPTKTPDQILKDYQVADDETAVWSPKLGGLIPIPFAPSQELTKTEGKLLDGLTVDKGLMGLQEFKAIKERAFAVSEAKYPAPSTFPAHAPTNAAKRNVWIQNDGHRDAFRHCYWNALLTKNFGVKWAKEFATAHEAMPGNPAEREAMDLYNNEVGRSIASSMKGASEDDLATAVQTAVSGGRLIVIDKTSKLAFSDKVALWDHGETGHATAGGAIPVPDGDATAKQDS